MTKNDALDIVYTSLDSENSITVKLRSRQGLDVNQFSLLKEAILLLISVYKDEELVPKRLALCFVDITNFFYFTEDLYDPDSLEEIEDAGIWLSEMANQLFEGRI